MYVYEMVFHFWSFIRAMGTRCVYAKVLEKSFDATLQFYHIGKWQKFCYTQDFYRDEHVEMRN